MSVRLSPVAHRLVLGAVWSLLGSAAARLLSLLAGVVAARVLGKAAFGQFGIIQSTVGMFAVLGGFGIGSSCTKFVSEARLSDPNRASSVIAHSRSIAAVTGALAATALVLGAAPLANLALAAPQLTLAIRLGAPLLLFGSLSGAQLGALAGLQDFRGIAQVNFLAGLISFPLTALGVVIAGVEGAVVATAFSSLAAWLLAERRVRVTALALDLPLRPNGNPGDLRPLLAFALPIVLLSVLGAPVTWVCNSMLARSPQGYDALGSLSATGQWFTIVVFMSSNLGQALFPTISERAGASDLTSIRRLLSRLTLANLAVGLPVTILASAAHPFILSLYGGDYAGDGLLLITVLFSAWTYCFHIFFNQALIATGHPWLSFWMHLVWALVFVVATSQFLALGALGFSIGRLLSYFVQVLGTAILLNRAGFLAVRQRAAADGALSRSS